MAEEHSEAVTSWYQFPEDKALRHAFANDYLYGPSEKQSAKYESQAVRTFMLVAGAHVAGYYAYCYGQYPNGKVIRDRLQATWSPLKRMTVKGLPFLGLALGLVVFRDFTREQGLKDSYWDQVKKDKAYAAQKRFANQ
mmetsp:Transcript_47757/g.55238  ORF Transcript_47757/g.55238 Transcript_47757/m.55238 type:complete len:138 (+) Transcript_47757:37-450(+)|eukprot:CAMPEP_0176425210 /NCGR_PEP_ID=MMETSP0127-20121128/11266_1 /TAXON_ID=938130 /ORGANISM="Platyophrya macrostoma, Strain WH" /LENGTH=137 /DNA_ID=CAMNT_0017806353 /DNA_START=28 /DNA_END=441 /DNA_ORIENTATION=+